MTTKLKAKLAREVLRSEIKKIGKNIKELEKESKNSLNSEIAYQLSNLKKSANIVSMAISLYRNKVHARRINYNLHQNTSLQYKFNLKSQIELLKSIVNLPPFFSFISPKISSAIKSIILWHQYKLTHPLPKKKPVDNVVKPITNKILLESTSYDTNYLNEEVSCQK